MTEHRVTWSVCAARRPRRMRVDVADYIAVPCCTPHKSAGGRGARMETVVVLSAPERGRQMCNMTNKQAALADRD